MKNNNIILLLFSVALELDICNDYSKYETVKAFAVYKKSLYWLIVTEN